MKFKKWNIVTRKNIMKFEVNKTYSSIHNRKFNTTITISKRTNTRVWFCSNRFSACISIGRYGNEYITATIMQEKEIFSASKMV